MYQQSSRQLPVMLGTDFNMRKLTFQHKNRQWGTFQCLEIRTSYQKERSRGLVLMSDIFGYETELTILQSRRFLEAGVVQQVLIPDLFLNNPFPLVPLADKTAVMETWRNENAMPYERIVDIVLTVVMESLNQDTTTTTTSFGLVGYCYGGGRLTEVMIRDDLPKELKTGVAFYGTQINPENINQMKKPVLMIFAELDKLVPLEIIAAIRKGMDELPEQCKGQIEVFPQRDHAFVHGGREADKADAEKALGMSFDWFNNHL